MVIRRAEAEDMAGVMSVVNRVFDEQGIPEEMNPISADRHPIWWCIEEEGRILGAISCFTDKEGKHLGRFAMLPELRGRGAGTALIDFVLDDIFSHSRETITYEARDVSVHITEKYGAVVAGETTPFYGDNITPMILTYEAYTEARRQRECH